MPLTACLFLSSGNLLSRQSGRTGFPVLSSEQFSRFPSRFRFFLFVAGSAFFIAKSVRRIFMFRFADTNLFKRLIFTVSYISGQGRSLGNA